MKLKRNKGFVQKILIVLVSLILVNFTTPIQSHAEESYFGGKLFKPIFQLLADVADVPIGLLHHYMLGTYEIYDSVTLDEDDEINVKNGIWKADKTDFDQARITKTLGYGKPGEDGSIDDDGWLWTDRDMQIPNILYCPEYIFANRIAALDVDFINPGVYTNATGNEDASIASQLTKTVSDWYKALRNVAVVGLLSVLVYIGIRILIGSTAQDKAKYKERLKDWFVGLCLLFAMHYIMAGVMMINEVITTNLSKSLNDDMIYIHVTDHDEVGNDGYFKTNYMGYIRLMVQSKNYGDALGYLMMYIALVIFTIMFTITYLKRVLYMAFFTMIAPLVAMTYPLDKLADGNAQGFNMWFREYVLNAIIQPVHLILYYILISSVIELAVNNTIYGIVALAFLLPAEKFIKKMFRFDKGETTSALGAVAGGALAMKAVNGIGRVSKGLSAGKGGKGDNDRIRTIESPETLGRRGKNDGIDSPEDVLSNERLSLNDSNTTNNNNVDEQDNAHSSNILNGPVYDNDGNVKPYLNYNMNTGEFDPNYNPEDDETWTSVNDNRTADQRFLDSFGPGEARRYYNPSTGRYERNKPVSEDGRLFNDEMRNRAGELYGPFYKAPERFKRIRGIHDRLSATRGGRVASALGNKGIRYAKNIPGRLKNTAIKGFKAVPGVAVKTATRAAGIATTGAIAAGAAITAGDAKTAASMLGAGAMIGNGLGGSIGRRITNNSGNFANDIGSTISDAWFTESEKQQRKQVKKAKYDKDWKQKEENYKYLTGKGMSDKEAKEYLQDQYTQRFLNAGVTDINMIYNAREMMRKSNGKIKIEGAVARAQLAQSVSDDFKNNRNEQNAFSDSMKRKNSNVDTEELIQQIIKIRKKED